MERDAWYRRYAWLLFVLVGVSGLIPGIQLLVAPLSGESYLRTFGHPVPEVVFASEEGVSFLAFFLQWTGIMVIGVDLLTVLIASTAFRRGEKWAWYAFWYWPFVFGAHFFMYAGGFRNTQLVWLVLTVGGLLLAYPSFFRRKRSISRSEPAQVG